MGNKGFKILFYIYLGALVVDLFSTVINWGLIRYLESNPLYSTGGLPLIIIINLIIAGFYWYSYNSTTNLSLRYIIIFSLVAVIITRTLIITSNISTFIDYRSNPVVILEAAKQVTPAQKVQYIKKFALLNILPFFNAVFTWLFFKIDHKVKIK